MTSTYCRRRYNVECFSCCTFVGKWTLYYDTTLPHKPLAVTANLVRAATSGIQCVLITFKTFQAKSPNDVASIRHRIIGKLFGDIFCKVFANTKVLSMTSYRRYNFLAITSNSRLVIIRRRSCTPIAVWLL